jgi:CubicO group peptidase (beta-lactamase class C family)
MRFLPVSLCLLLLVACSKKETDPAAPGDALATYFPPIGNDEWENTDAQTLGWDVAKLNDAISYAASNKTYGLMILYKGRIVTEKYWNGWNLDTKYPINSAGKSITAFLVGVAQKEGLLNINHKTSQYLGNGWTSLPASKENAITIRHQLTMTTGLDDTVPDDNCKTPSCLTYKADAGTRWAYHNAPYRLLQDVVEKAADINFNQFTKTRLSDKIGMKNSFWFNHVLFLSTRDMARFGLLTLHRCSWNGIKVLDDDTYFSAMINTSQSLNLSYGYLWWLNGKASVMLPSLQTVFNGPLAPDAPPDLLMALGKDDKKIYVSPSLDLVVVRHGDDAGTSTAGPSSFDNAFWAKLRLAIKRW